MKLTIQDVFAGVFATVALVGLVVLALNEQKVPAELTTVIGLAAGWRFRGQANGRKIGGNTP